MTTYAAIANGDLEAVSGDVAAVAGHPPIEPGRVPAPQPRQLPTTGEGRSPRIPPDPYPRYARVRALRTRAISRSASRLARDWRLS